MQSRRYAQQIIARLQSLVPVALQERERDKMSCSYFQHVRRSLISAKLKVSDGCKLHPDSLHEHTFRHRTACGGIWPQKSRKTEPKNPRLASSTRKNY
jgi:hypothetical protein